MKSFLRLIVIIILNSQLSILNSSCTQDGYDKGEGQYSYLRGDFVEAQIGADKNMVSLMTDEGETLPLSQPYTAKWITRSDTVYRCMLYYNKVRDSKGQTVAETDPVKFESAWMSKTGKYINLSFALKTGTTEDEEAIHSLRVVQDTILTNPDGTSTSYLRLYHDQGGVPDYYSTQVYASLITSEILADSACISINTYKGIITKAFQIKKE